MKKYFNALLLVFFMTLASGCSNLPLGDNEASIPSDFLDKVSTVRVSEEGYTDLNVDELSLELSRLKESALSPEEVKSLTYMREEEKLAHDLYVFLYETWGQKSFNTISESESTHAQAVKVLLDRYSLVDPATGKGLGVFENEVLQGLYDELKERGEVSLVEALKVGALVEEVDIMDLNRDMLLVSHKDISLVYENLLMGSRNHLRAYVRNLKAQGVEYSPVYLEEGVYEGIVGAEVERGGGR